ncbi:aspartyl/asparaginyl beta-hydroxylase domain-containing protein [Gloeothece verrucosa]|uniref:Aspartyl/asparaginy/proline hydroxylase domain-containing protein n=1 Tax=Gloeothece verrucosa (strain PCC 7822) TaxID=497965 RepID=E0UL42_GLOV7|nr:aspartyl/asparaginyl beta-hydroxylase domain-containing protein [Gloeothece verrucosa]ADN17672.1 hypothetical protein Cyan7822_5817 [Gloeothece verrucosa PCC 7822]
MQQNYSVNQFKNFSELLSIVSQVKKLPPTIINQMRQEIEEADLDWQNSSYSEYISGDFLSISLLSHDGDSANTIIRDCTPKPTAALNQLPETKRFLEQCGLDLMWVRLNLLKSDAFFVEHKDYSELDDKPRLRLHIPIKTNPESYIVLSGYRIHLHENAIWKLNPADAVHGAINNGSYRIHLLLDCYINDNLKALLTSESLNKHSLKELQSPSGKEYEKIMEGALKVYQQGFKKEAEALLLKTFYNFKQPEGTSLDLVMCMYQRLGLHKEADIWRKRKERFLYQESLKNVLTELNQYKNTKLKALQKLN